MAKVGQPTLRISIAENETAVEVTLEGRLVGPWVAELSKAWSETAPRLGKRKLVLNLRNITYADAEGKQTLRAVVRETGAELVTSSPWTQYLAEEISK